MSTLPKFTQQPALAPDALAALDRAGFSRRRFLKGAGALIVTFSAGGITGAAFGQARGGAGQGRGGAAPDPGAIPAGRLDSWIAIGADGRVTAYTGKAELGQGISTAQIQLVAEELCVPFERVNLVYCDTSMTPDQGVTSGSQSHPTNFNHGALALASATAREALVKLASQRLGVAADQLTAANGVITARTDQSKRVSYGELIGGRKFELQLDTNAKRKPHSEWTVLGKPARRQDLPAIVTGQLEYVHNVRLPGMLHGRVVRPPTVGATVAGVDESSVAGMPGLVKVVVKNNFVGVVAEKPWQAVQAAERLKVNWNPGTGMPSFANFYQHMRTQPVRDTLLVDSKDVDQTMARAATQVKATYYHPYQMHGSLGTSCAVADVQGDQATLYSPTQGVWPNRSSSARLLGLPIQNVRVIFRRGSGCYGLNGADTVTFDAALLSQAVNRPVRVQLSRKDEMVWGENYGLPFVIDMRAGLDAQGNIIAWDCENWSAAKGGRPGANNPGNVITGALAGVATPAFQPRTPSPEPMQFNNGTNGIPSYFTGRVGNESHGSGSIKSERVMAHVVESSLFTAPLRSPARLQNTFAHECFMDEIAAQAKADPVAFRLRHLSDPRLAECVRQAARAAGWQARPSPRMCRPAGAPARRWCRL